MKKLLILLICLFVSFEVRSDDDLSGKQLLCEFENIHKIKHLQGFRFLDSKKVTLYDFMSIQGGWLSEEKDTWIYETSLEFIEVKRDPRLSYPESLKKYYLIERQTLELTTIHNSFDYKFSKRLCKLFSGNMSNFFENLKESYIKNKKNKQKI